MTYERVHNIVSQEEQKQLVFKAQAGDKRAVDTLVKNNSRLVMSVANKYRDYISKACIDFDDMVQAGMLGLTEAVYRFKENRGATFISYAQWWIYGYIKEHIKYNFYPFKHLGGRSSKIFFKMTKISQMSFLPDAERKKREQEFVDKSSVRKQDLEAIKGFLGTVSVGTLSEHTLPNSSYSPSIFNDIYQEQLEHFLDEGWQVLSERESKVLRKRYKLEPDTFAEIGAELNVSRQRVEQIQNNALRKLKQYLVDRGAEERLEFDD